MSARGLELVSDGPHELSRDVDNSNFHVTGFRYLEFDGRAGIERVWIILEEGEDAYHVFHALISHSADAGKRDLLNVLKRNRGGSASLHPDIHVIRLRMGNADAKYDWKGEEECKLLH